MPHGAKNAGGKAVSHLQLHFLFKDGSLVERRLVAMPAKKVLRRETFSAEGTVTVRDSDDKALLVVKGTLEECREPSLTVDVKNLVVLDLPFRSPAHVRQTLKLEKKGNGDLTFDEARQLLTAFVANGEPTPAQEIFQQALANREQRQLGYYVLLAAAGVNLDSDNIDVLDAHPHNPLAQYLSLHSSPVLRKHASRWAAASNTWGAGFLGRLGMGHAFCQRWASGKSLGASAAQRQGERLRALAYVKEHKGTALAWALLGLVQDRTSEEKDSAVASAAYRELAAAYELFTPTPGLANHARYEQARCLWKAGQKAKARKRFLALYEEAGKQGALLAIDADFRAALLTGKEDGWSALLRRTAARLVQEKNRFAVLLLARQVWQLDDAAMAQHLFAVALKDAPTRGKEALPLQHAALTFLMETAQTDAADQRTRTLLRRRRQREERRSLAHGGEAGGRSRDAGAPSGMPGEGPGTGVRPPCRGDQPGEGAHRLRRSAGAVRAVGESAGDAEPSRSGWLPRQGGACGRPLAGAGPRSGEGGHGGGEGAARPGRTRIGLGLSHHAGSPASGRIARVDQPGGCD